MLFLRLARNFELFTIYSFSFSTTTPLGRVRVSTLPAWLFYFIRLTCNFRLFTIYEFSHSTIEDENPN